MIGAISLDQDLETAMAAAVVGPPIHAFEARIASSKLNLNTLSYLIQQLLNRIIIKVVN